MDKCSVKTAVILAGGLGTRLRSVVSDRPKPLALVDGRPFIHYLIEYWEHHGIQKFYILVGYLGNQIVDYLSSVDSISEFVFLSEDFPRGTGGALLNMYQIVHPEERFFLLNGDTFFAVSPTELLQSAVRHDADWTFSLFSSSNDTRYKPLVLSDTGIVTLPPSQKTYTQQNHYVNGGVYLVNPRCFEDYQGFHGPCSLEDDLLPVSSQRKRIMSGVSFSSDTFIDIGLPSDYDRAQSLSFFRKD